MDNIILATDLSSNTDRAMERALKIAQEQQARLHIVHVAPAYPSPKSEDWAVSLQKDAEDLVQAYLYDYRDAEGLDINIIVMQGGDIYAGILEQAYTHKADLIVMGMHGKEKFRDLFFGTTVERVIRKGIKPVLMVKDKPTGPYQSIMGAVDFMPASRNALRTAIKIAPKGIFHAVHVYNVPIYYSDPSIYVYTHGDMEETQKKNMDAFVNTELDYYADHHDGAQIKLKGILEQGAIYDCLIKKAENLKAGLLTIGGHGRAGFPSKLGGAASDLLSNPPCDILVSSEVNYS